MCRGYISYIQCIAICMTQHLNIIVQEIIVQDQENSFSLLTQMFCITNQSAYKKHKTKDKVMFLLLSYCCAAFQEMARF